MAQGARLSTVVMFVRDLERSVRFYTELLALTIADRSPTAALLVSESGAHLVLRSMGPSAAHPLGNAGVQYVAWSVAGEDELARTERVLKAHSAHVETRNTHGVTVAEGRDPDGIPVILCQPGPDQLPADQQHLWARIYAW
jgi:catechol 2,3-dioxygenase-like lactoylglutathione lyase family enzyme